jgi:hypothetical protein
VIVEKLIQWARAEAAALRDSVKPRECSPAVDFLQRNGGETFASKAQYFATDELNDMRMGASTLGTRRRLGDLLEAWATYAEAGMVDALPLEALIRVEAATDLMEQVQHLLDSKETHVAAPIVLAGAALEEFLRSMMVGCSETITGAPSLSKYAAALRKCRKLTAQDEKNITSWAGTRNKAAHGEFDDLTDGEARIMVAGINLFMQQKTTT